MKPLHLAHNLYKKDETPYFTLLLESLKYISYSNILMCQSDLLYHKYRTLVFSLELCGEAAVGH